MNENEKIRKAKQIAHNLLKSGRSNSDFSNLWREIYRDLGD